MTAPDDQPGPDGFWTQWQLVSVQPDAATYANRLGRAAADDSAGALPVIVAYGKPLDVVIVWIVLPADDLVCAIERSLQSLAEVIDRAALRLPGRIEILAGIQGRAPEGGEG